MKNKRIKSGIIIIVFAFMLVLSLFAGQGVTPAFAETSNFSSVLADLQKDSNFNFADYPENSKDYSIQVIQIAESKQGNLYLYTYQPCQNTKKLVATEINMSLTESVDGTKLYGLNRVSTWGVFAKYLVTGVKVSSNNIRYYNISSIYREWVKGIDEETGNDNDINAVAFPVGKCYSATTKNGEIVYSCEDRETVEILNPWVGFLRYNDGFLFHVSACDSHFVAFNTDLKIDTLYEADLVYETRSVHEYYKVFHGVVKDYGVSDLKYAYLTDDQRYMDKATGWLWGQDRDYNRIQSVSDFIKGESEILGEETKEKLNGKQWVLRFIETDYSEVPDQLIGAVQCDKNYTEVSNVSILRLKFKSEGKVLNLGAVSDKVTGDDIPDNVNNKGKKGFWAYIWNSLVKLFIGKAGVVETIVAVLTLVVVVIAVVLAVKFIKFVVNGLFG